MREQLDVEQVMEMMDILVDVDSAETISDPQLALQRFKQTAASPVFLRSKPIMTTQRKTMFGAILVLALFIFIGTFPATRAWASDMLSVFRVAKFAPISVSPQQLQFLDEIMQNGEDFYPGEFTFVDEPQEPQAVASLSELSDQLAANKESTAIRTLKGYGDPAIRVGAGGAGTLTIDLAGARNLLEAADIDPLLLPDSLDGQDVNAFVDRSIMQEFDGVFLMQMPSPEINYPDGVDPQPIGEALLRLLGMDEKEAARLASNIDWGGTLLMPIPAEFATFAEVEIDGTTGLAIEAIEGGETSLMWQSGGTVYMLAADGVGSAELLKVADSLTWYSK